MTYYPATPSRALRARIAARAAWEWRNVRAYAYLAVMAVRDGLARAGRAVATFVRSLLGYEGPTAVVTPAVRYVAVRADVAFGVLDTRLGDLAPFTARSVAQGAAEALNRGLVNRNHLFLWYPRGTFTVRHGL